MLKLSKFGSAILAFGIFLLFSSQANAQERQFVTIGTGSVLGVYYPAGLAICNALTKAEGSENITCSVEATAGSIANLMDIREGELEFAIAQSDWQFHAFNGSAVFDDDDANKELRTVFSLHPEPFTVLARKDAGITKLEDLKGKRVNIGNEGSGQRATMELVMDVMGWTESDFAEVTDLTASEQAPAMCNGLVDAVVYTVGHPSAAIEEASRLCDVVFITVSNEKINDFVAANSYYRFTRLPAELYDNIELGVQTFGVGATFVTSAEVSQRLVYNLTKAVFEDLEAFKEFRPAFKNLKEAEMIKEGLTAPLHPGAIQYYKEQGWL